MKPFDYSLLPQEGAAVLTVRELDGEGPMCLADFRDTQVLKYKPTGHYIGYVLDQGIRLCQGPLKMVNGLWVARVDEEANRKHQNVQLGLDNLDFLFVS